MAESFFPHQTLIQRAIIRNLDGSEFDLLAKNQGNTPFFKMLMRESLFEPMVTGTLFVQDKGNYGEKMNFVGGEIIEIDIETPISEGDSELQFPNDSLGLVSRENLTQNLKFYVHRVRSLTDDATIEIDSEVGPATMWNLDFGPYEMVYFNKTDAPLYNGEFTGKIAGEDSLVEYFANKYFTPSENSTAKEEMDIEPTLNSIWYKANQASYPWGKNNTPYLELGRFMNYLSEHAVSEDNVGAVNYLFWQDLNRWHFRSVDSLIRAQSNPRTYKISNDKTGKDKIQSFHISKQIDQSELLNSDAYRSFYVHVEPNYDDPYSDYIPTNDKLRKQRIEYDYFTDYEKWSHIEENPLLPDSLKYEDVNSNEMNDEIYGWFSQKEHNDQKPTKLDYYGNVNQKNSMDSWQTMFDMTDLDIETLKKVRNEVILASKENYNLYARKRLLKEKWNVYKYSICCDKQAVAAVEGGSGARILGWITGFERYSLPEDDQGLVRKIWKYTWLPVEVWPKDEIENLQEIDDGITYDVVAKQGPFAVITLPQEQGVTLEAWNMNELNNSFAPNELNLLYDYLGPGLNNYNLLGYNPEQITIEGNLASYHYLPVGSIIPSTIGTYNDGINDVNTTDYISFNLEYAGQLVELFQIPNQFSVLQKVQETEDQPLRENVYMFNVNNAIDGTCVPSILGELEEI